MKTMFVAVLSDKPEKRLEFCSMFGTPASSQDISLYGAEINGKTRIIVEPITFPSKIQSLLHSLAIADFVVLIVDQLTPQIGEIIVALDMLKKEEGILISSVVLPISGTVLAKYERVTDVAIAKAKILELQTKTSEEELFALIHNSSTGEHTGTVAHGVVKSGTLTNIEPLHLLPLKKEVTIRSILVNGKEVKEAKTGDSFEIHYKGDPLQVGVLAPFRNNLEVNTSVNGRFIQSPFFKDELNHKVHMYHNFQYVEGIVSGTELLLDKPIAYAKGDRILVVDSSNQKLRIAGVFASAW